MILSCLVGLLYLCISSPVETEDTSTGTANSVADSEMSEVSPLSKRTLSQGQVFFEQLEKL